MAARVAAPRRSIAGIVLFVSVLIAGAAWYFRLPGAVVLWLGVMVVAWSEPPAILNGKKDQYGYPTAANPSEEGAIRRHRIWSGLRWRLVGFSDNRPSGIPVLGIPIRNVQRWLSFRRWQHSVAGDPNAPKGLLKRGLTWWGREGSSLHETSDWLPGWPVLGSWLGAIIAGIAGWLVPVNVELLHIPEWAAHLVSAVCLFSIIACIAGQARRNATDGPGCPGTRINSLVRMGGHPAAAAVILAGAVAAGGAAAWAALRFVPSTGDYAVTSRIPLAVVAAGVVVTLVITTPWRTTALAQWRELCRANREWTPRWQALKVDPAPTLIKRERVGLAVVDTFVASGGQGALAFWLLGPKINPTFGGDGVVGVMSVPSTDVEGQPVAGTKHSTRFQIAVWPPGAVPDLADPNTSEPEADLVLRAGSVWGLGLAGYGLPILIDKQRITADGSPGQAWATVWAFPDGGDWDSYRRDPNAPGLLAKGFSGEVLVDHRNPVDGAVYIGSLSDPSVEWSQEMPPPLCASWPEFFDQVRDEDNWNSMWGSTMKQGTNPPTPQYPVYAEAELADGSLVKRMPFMVRTGMTPSEFSGLEEKLSTSLGAAPFVAITGWPAQGDARPGDRHPMALTVYWSTSPVPARLDDLPPKRASAGSDANQWVIAGKMNAAFTNGRLARPEVISAKPLTSPASSKHIWKIAVRLYGGVTLAEVVGARRKLQEALGVTWLRVEPREQDGCVIYAGAPPASVKLLSPRRDELTLAALDWDQAFLDSGVTGAGGHLPRLTATDHLPHNTKVQVLDFRLPPGVDIEKMKAGIGKLRSATGNSFIEVRPGPSGASSIRLLVCEDDPMPERVSYDFGFSDAAGALPLATGVEGEPLTIDLREIPH
ncbi:MAG: hypothetical protein M3Y35_12390, partial [Actinomycetota bacterium]|nr:hypothetical protein [Actinomycetota bacterium]